MEYCKHGRCSSIMYINALIVYALCDARTHQIRYIGSSELGLSRPTNPAGYKSNPDLHRWYRDLVVCGSEPTVLVLSRATDVGQLRSFEAYWIKQGKHWGWPLLNKQGFSLDIEEKEAEPVQPKTQAPALKPEGRRWSLEQWRRDPSAMAALATARESRLLRRKKS